MTNPLETGDKVKLRYDVLSRHSRSVPAHAGYTKEQFYWRDTLDKLDGKIGVVERTFPGSKHTNVRFGKTLIGIDWTELVKVGGIQIRRISVQEYEKQRAANKMTATYKSRTMAEKLAKILGKKVIYVLPDGKHVVRK